MGMGGGGRSAIFPLNGRRNSVIFLLLVVSVGYSGAHGPTFASKLPLRLGSMAMEHAEVVNTVPASWLVAQHENEEYKYHDGYNTEEKTAIPEENPFQPPSIDVPDMALALRWAAEVNRRLQVGTQSVAVEGKQQQHLLAPGIDHLRGGGGGAVMTTYRIPSTVKQQNDDVISIFHAQTPRSRARGEARWGPDLETFLRRLVNVVLKSESSDPELELTLAMIYLDRACSVETPRSVAQCPFCTPRTVHRLALTAMLVAVAAVRGISDMAPIYGKVEAAFGISAATCQSMMEWMSAALGEAGIFVTPDEMREWKRVWEARFAP
jgi:hypothetical protein